MEADVLTDLRLVQKGKLDVDPQWAKIVREAIGDELNDLLPIIWEYAIEFSLNLCFTFNSQPYSVNFTRMDFYPLLSGSWSFAKIKLACSYSWYLDRANVYTRFYLRATPVYVEKKVRHRLHYGGICSQQHNLCWQGPDLFPLSDFSRFGSGAFPLNIDGLSLSALVEKLSA